MTDSHGLPVIGHYDFRPEWLSASHEEALAPDLPIVDAHHHLWDRQGGYLLDELAADLSSGHKVATAFVQCGYAYRKTGPVSLQPVGDAEAVSLIAREAEQRGHEELTRSLEGQHVS